MRTKQKKQYVIRFRNQHPEVRARRRPTFLRNAAAPLVYSLADDADVASVFTSVEEAEKTLSHISSIRLPSLVGDMTYLHFFYLKLFGVTMQDHADGLDVRVSDSVIAHICEMKSTELLPVKRVPLECTVW